MNTRLLLSAVAALALTSRSAQAQTVPDGAARDTTARRIAMRGTVSRVDGRPIAFATVYVLETLEEARTDSLGRYALSSTTRGIVTMVARGVGYLPQAFDVTLSVDTAVNFLLAAQPPLLGIVTVLAAGEYTLGSGQTSTLTPLDIAQTPGAAANVARAIQTLPGAQSVDEGTGLFVRGGDVTETRVLIDEAWLLSPLRSDNPTGHVTSTVNPFLLSRTVFSSGGFGARYGNALSGLVRMETADAPTRATGTLSASIGALSAAVGAKPHARLGLRASAGLSNLGPLFSTFGQAQPFDPPLRGGDVSGTAEWRTGSSGRIRVFGVRQASEFGVGDASQAGNTRYAARANEGMSVVSWRDSSTVWRPAVTLAWSGHDRQESFGTFALRTRLAAPQLVTSLGWRDDRGTMVTVGAETEHLTARYDGRQTFSTGDTSRPVFGVRSTSTRRALYVDVTRTFVSGVRVIAGVRSDHSTLTKRQTVDPRVSLAWQRGTLGLTAAWGIYHQIAEPTFQRNAAARFEPMRVAQSVVGLQWGTDSAGLRLEGYRKEYTNLWQFSSSFAPIGGGRGNASGVDLQARLRFNAVTRSRLSYSHVRSVRTDPTSGMRAPSLADITHSIILVTDRTIGAFTIGTALRYATGRPFTDVVGVVPASTPVQPVLGAAWAERLPAYSRADLSGSWYRGLGQRRGMVLWASASNVLAKQNVMRYRWSDDYRNRFPVLAPFNRSVFAGSTLLF